MHYNHPHNMKLLIIILLITYINLFVFGENIIIPKKHALYKTQLRGLHKEELEKVTQEHFMYTLTSIYDQIIERAKMGYNEYHFTILCKELNCELHRDRIRNRPYNIVAITNSYITIEQYATKLIGELNLSFPDSNIKKIYKNCCDYYIIEW
jgi:hypothetical protein